MENKNELTDNVIELQELKNLEDMFDNAVSVPKIEKSKIKELQNKIEDLKIKSSKVQDKLKILHEKSQKIDDKIKEKNKINDSINRQLHTKIKKLNLMQLKNGDYKNEVSFILSSDCNVNNVQSIKDVITKKM